MEAHQSEDYDQMAQNAWLTVFGGKWSETIKINVLSEVNKMTTAELWESIEEADFDDIVEFYSLFESLKDLEAWESKIEARQIEILRLNKDYAEMCEEAKWEVFEEEMEKREWTKENADLVEMIFNFNAMSDEQFKVEISTWTKQGVKAKLEHLKNCDEMMRVIDLFDQSKFVALQAQFGKDFALK
jgi:hypothetical protein